MLWPCCIKIKTVTKYIKHVTECELKKIFSLCLAHEVILTFQHWPKRNKWQCVNKQLPHSATHEVRDDQWCQKKQQTTLSPFHKDNTGHLLDVYLKSHINRVRVLLFPCSDAFPLQRYSFRGHSSRWMDGFLLYRGLFVQ